MGCRVRYETGASVLQDLTAALADQTLERRLRSYGGFDLMILDEFGFDRVERQESPQAASLLYKADQRAQRAIHRAGDEHRLRVVERVPGRSAIGDGLPGPGGGRSDHPQDEGAVVRGPPGGVSRSRLGVEGVKFSRSRGRAQVAGSGSIRPPPRSRSLPRSTSPLLQPATTPVAQSWPRKWLTSWPRSTTWTDARASAPLDTYPWACERARHGAVKVLERSFHESGAELGPRRTTPCASGLARCRNPCQYVAICAASSEGSETCQKWRLSGDLQEIEWLKSLLHKPFLQSDRILDRVASTPGCSTRAFTPRLTREEMFSRTFHDRSASDWQVQRICMRLSIQSPFSHRFRRKPAPDVGRIRK